MIKIIALLNMFSTLLMAMTVESETSRQPVQLAQSNNFKLDNYTGASITPAMVSYMTKTLNEAYQYYLEDL